MKRLLTWALCTVLALGAAGCTRQGQGAFPPKEEPTRQLDQAMEAFAARTAGQVITPEREENLCYSPLSLYVAEGLAAWGLEGEARQAVLAQLYGREDPEQMGKQMNSLLNWLNSGGEEQLTVANSLWIDEGNADALPGDFEDQARAVYGAPVTTGDLGGEKMARQMSRWVAENTHGKLKPAIEAGQAKSVALNVLYFKGQWEKTFDKKDTREQAFYGPGGPVQSDFMHRSFSGHAFVQAADYTGTVLEMSSGATMEFILPREGLTPADLLADEGQAAQILTWDKAQWERGRVRLALPKFEYGGAMDLTGLMPPGAELRVEQGTYIKVDEQGAEAAAYTAAAGGAAPEPPKELDLVLDRPFLYTLHAPDGTLLFVGAVQDPTA